MDEGDRQRLRDRAHRPAVERDRARVGFVDAGQDLDQRRLAGAVLAEQRVDLAAPHVEIDVVERQRRGEALDEARSSSEQPARRRVLEGMIGIPDIRGCDDEAPPAARMPAGRRSRYFTPQISR